MADIAPMTHYQGSKPRLKKANGKTFKQAPVQVKPVKKPKGRGK